jgi:dienelactone hydrolase
MSFSVTKALVNWVFPLWIALGIGTCAAEPVVLQSTSFANLTDALRGQSPQQARVPAQLLFPEPANPRRPAVVLAHTVGGYSPLNEGWFANRLRKAGFATLTYDSFLPRGFGDVTAASNQAVTPAVISDAFAALKLLAEHPKIDRERIGIVGFSLGGDTAHMASFESVRARFAAEHRFAAHVVFYPAWVFGTIGGAKAYTGAPVLLLFAEKDELTPPAKIQSYLAYHAQQNSNAPLQVITYRGAYHAWTAERLKTPRFFSSHSGRGKCPLLLVGGSGGRLLIDGRERPFDAALWQRCGEDSRGYTMGFDEAVRSKSLEATLALLRAELNR